MRQLMLPLTALLLSACTLLGPSGPASPSPELAAARARGAQDSGSVTLAADPQRVLVAPGATALYLRAIVITGAGLRYNDARCATTGPAEVTCTYGEPAVALPHRFGQPVGGTDVHGTVLYARSPGGEVLAKTF